MSPRTSLSMARILFKGAKSLKKLQTLQIRRHSDLTQSLFFLAQFFGVMPKRSYTIVYAAVLILCTFLLALSCFLTKITKYGLQIGKVSPFIFYTVNGFIQLQFLLLAKRQAAVTWQWKLVEDKISLNRKVDHSDAKNVQLLVIMVLLGALSKKI